MRVLENCEPKQVFYYFEEICKIPHGSRNTKQISDYLVAFAKEHGFDYVQDEMNNVIIYKPATPGYENAPTVILQGHMDMVCEKRPDVQHDFEKDGLNLSVKDGYVTANGTTLGGDDGIAVQHRGGKGVKCYKITEKTGNVIGAKAVDDTREVMLITTEGIIIRLACRDISTLGRITSGVKLINLDEGVKVATVSKVRKNPSDENGSEASDENGYSEENIATDTQEDAVDIQDKSIDRLLDAAEKDQQQ